jgi:hypothetical protein
MRVSDLHRRIIASKKEDILLLDAFPNASAAYSLRKLSSSYTGNCIQVRRSSDNALQNIGFVNNVLDTASLLSFVGAGSGFVRTWYDQSGNARNATQTTSANQPIVVNSGVLETKNAKNAILFQLKSLLAPRALSSSNFSVFGVVSLNTIQFETNILAQHPGSAFVDRTVFLTTSASPNRFGRLFFNNGTSFSVLTTNQYNILGNLDLFESHSDGNGTSKVYLNTTGEGVLTGQNWTPRDVNLSIGSFDGSISQTYDGYISEIIIYTPSQLNNKTPIESNINSFYNIY